MHYVSLPDVSTYLEKLEIVNNMEDHNTENISGSKHIFRMKLERKKMKTRFPVN